MFTAFEFVQNVYFNNSIIIIVFRMQSYGEYDNIQG